MEQLNLNDEDIQQVLLAGSFGSYLSPASAIQIGLVPKSPVMRIVSAGNVAGEGAKMVLQGLVDDWGCRQTSGNVCGLPSLEGGGGVDRFGFRKI